LDLEWTEAARYASLWATWDTERIRNIKIFWVLMDMTVHQWITQLPHLTDEIYESIEHISKFKEDMHHVYIKV